MKMLLVQKGYCAESVMLEGGGELLVVSAEE